MRTALSSANSSQNYINSHSSNYAESELMRCGWALSNSRFAATGLMIITDGTVRCEEKI